MGSLVSAKTSNNMFYEFTVQYFTIKRYRKNKEWFDILIHLINSNVLINKWSRFRICWHETGFGLTWWRHQMEKFSALLVLCAGKSPVTAEFPSQRPVTGNFDMFFELRPNKQSWGWWFETPSHSLWRHYNEILFLFTTIYFLGPYLKSRSGTC